MTTQLCKQCKKDLDITLFGKWTSRRYNRSGYHTRCKACVAENSNILYHSDPMEKARQARANDTWARKNRTTQYATQKRYRERLAAKQGRVYGQRNIPVYYAVHILSRQLYTGTSAELSLIIGAGKTSITTRAKSQEHVKGYYIFPSLEKAQDWIAHGIVHHAPQIQNVQYILRNIDTAECVTGTISQLATYTTIPQATLRRWANSTKKKILRHQWIFSPTPV